MTTIEYRAWRLRVAVAIMIAVFFLASLVVLSLAHATSFHCTGGREGRCSITSYALWTSDGHSRDFALRDIVEVKILQTSKPSSRAVLVKLITREQSNAAVVDLSNGAFGGGTFDPADAATARSLFREYQANPGANGDLRLWLLPNRWGLVLEQVFSLFFFVMGILIIRRVRQDARPVRIVVDRDAGKVTFPGEDGVREVAIDQIAEIELEKGQARTFEGGDKDKLPGYRIVFITRGDDDNASKRIPATEYRRPHEAPHLRALAELRAALPPLPGLEAEANDGAAKKRKKKQKKQKKGD